ncbi:hypothetical protein [Acrocarpospora sp. B8E8]|uniref:DUF6907 domain-containing protein n=1 Tax=Acrocarpospora sp. B8E8 TaxID=3153572 RepID=UPI00325E0A41
MSARWLTTPCPAWCATTHSDHDAPADREHQALLPEFPLMSMRFVNGGPPSEPRYEPVELLVELDQQYRETEPRIVIGASQDGDMHLTLDEAELHAHLVLELVRAARTNTPVSDDFTAVEIE